MQHLYESVRYENQRFEYHTRLKNLIQDQDQDIAACILLISKIQEHRHSKIKAKQIDKVDRLLKNKMDTIIILPFSALFQTHSF